MYKSTKVANRWLKQLYNKVTFQHVYSIALAEHVIQLLGLGPGKMLVQVREKNKNSKDDYEHVMRMFKH